MTLLIGLDLGTTRIKAALLDAGTGLIRAVTSRPTPVSHPRPGWSEHDPLELWQAAAGALRELAPALAGEPAAGVAISSMAEAGVPLDGLGSPLAPVIAWFDRRSEPQAQEVERRVSVEQLFAITGQRVSTSFSVTKILWLRDNDPAAFARMERWLPVSSFILYKLCKAYATDRTIASRTLLFDQPSAGWSGELFGAFGLKEGLLPPVFPGGTAVGRVTAEAAALTGLKAGTPVMLGGHDHLCAAFAAGGSQPGALVDSTGSAQAVILLVDRFLPDPRLAEGGYASYPFVLPGTYAVKGGLKAAGSGVEWLARLLSPAGEAPDWAALEAEARAGIGVRSGPLWMPHLIGSGSPQSDRHSRAALVGAKFEHTRGDLFRAMLEAMACWLRHNLETMQAITGSAIGEVALTGGVTRLDLLNQLKADVLNRPVTASEVPEAAAAGAALLAGLGAGVWGDPRAAAAALQYPRARFEPDENRAQWYDRIYREMYLPLYGALKGVNEAMTRMDEA